MKRANKKMTQTTATAIEPKQQSEGPPNNSLLTVEEFVLRAIEKLADPGRNTIHTVFSGFNEAFRDYFKGKNPIQEVKTLVAQGTISFRFCRGGALIGKPGAIAPTSSITSNTLKKMGL